MIFVTVGTQLPFDRLITAVDDWAAAQPGVEVFAQTGPTSKVPVHIGHVHFLRPGKAEELMRDAELIVAHAGMGSIVAALRHQRPILILPRRAALREHRNDHQMATAKWLATRPGIHVAWDVEELRLMLEHRQALHPGPPLGPFADGPLIERLRTYVQDTD